ncbi:MAG TPA: alpha/beta hydrolase [Gammaproteobacteria bacterium]|jgi:pimeloyl-ACP methyl ester carboxylesterase|nr:hypothetical protein [Chromatiales bacterium]MCP4926728.1 alpha/beta hydrolase [Gammaproteobacteria bacterium]HJP37576.1 alpha/beta hydrolase [Gammaproteobacteria bacterium]
MINQTSVCPVRVRATEYRLSVRFREDGDDLILFVHGLGCSKESWREAWQRSELRGKSLLATDLPGFGHTACPPGFGAQLDDYARVLGALIDAYALRRIHLVAHSMGGSIALLLPPQVLSRLESLVLVEPRLFRSSCGLAAMTAGVSKDEFCQSVFPEFRQRMSNDPKVVFDLGRVDTDAFYASSRSLMELLAQRTLLQHYQRAECRKFFVYGAENQHLQELACILPAQTIAIEQAGHFVMNDNPDSFYVCLSAIVDNLR